MARARTAFFCTECGNETPRWEGQCPACGAWNSLAEEPRPARPRSGRSVDDAHPAAAPPVRLGEVARDGRRRLTTGLEELDFVLGGGLVPGSVVLLGGEPGIGKSTLLLQTAGRLEQDGHATLYASGEESAEQVRLRADRLASGTEEVRFLGETSLEAVLVRAREASPAVLFVDSIQTLHSADLEGSPGSVGQVRECAARLQRFAKTSGTTVLLVGHVTKGGAVAGPRTLEHIVDTVLYFEATRGLEHRVIRATKNRFGAADEIGVFRMTESGLTPVPSPSALFLGERHADVSGSAVTAALEGSRPLLVEVQALCARASYGAPQRVAGGFDRQRLSLLLAVLEKRAGVPFAELDVFLNPAGGVRLVEPGADLAVVAALLSSALDRVAPPEAVFVGEVGLGGELRAVAQTERRLAEAARMGFARAFLPAGGAPPRPPGDLEIEPLRDVRALLSVLRA